MTKWDERENVEIFQALITRSMERKIAEENNEMLVFLEKNFQVWLNLSLSAGLCSRESQKGTLPLMIGYNPTHEAMYRELSVTRNENRAPNKLVWQDVKESMRSLLLQLNCVEKNLGKMERRLDQIEQYDEGDSYYQIGQSCWKNNEMMGKDFIVGYESYEGSRYSYIDDGYGHWYPYEQEASGPWSKKSKIEESAKSQEVMLEKNDTCEGKESHERIEIVEENKGINNFKSPRKRIGRKFHHNHKEISISFSSNFLPLSIEFSFNELMLFLNAHLSHEDVLGKLFHDSLSYHPSYLIIYVLKSSQSYTFLEYPCMLGDATRDHSCDNSLYDSRMKDYYSYVANVESFVLGVENKEERMLGVFGNKGKSLEKELNNLQEEITMSFSDVNLQLHVDFIQHLPKITSSMKNLY
ncbi:hypothetical protein M9H77_02422 [Catharanthus roseus]|uniref:Uncharacterized protein n=1 Tax=Catharanthus roseus TaxID=4058 RepID=A0ACC0C8H2_CATRO|nr:hypothetical protein M9H77_02422 [Catharanthus roseus]